MFLLTVYGTLYYEPTNTQSLNYSPEGELIVINQTGYINTGEPESFNIWNAETGALVLLTIAIAGATITGIRLFTFGLSEFTQKTMFNSVLFVGLWFALTIIVRYYLFQTTVTTLLWSSMTMMFIIGLGIHISSGDTSGD